MFLSIVIPIWNDEKFLNECLDSCLEQDLSKDEYEIICVDDGSTDRTPEILREYAKKYPNIRIISKEHTGGGGRNVGLDAARADFVWFVDHDDVLAPHALDELKETVLANPEYDRIAFPYYRFYTNFTPEERELIRTGGLQNCAGKSGNDYYVWSSIIRRAFLTEHGIRPWSLHIAEAGRFWEIEPFLIWGGDRAMMNECYEDRIRTLQLQGRPLYHYRIHAGQSISDADPQKVARREMLRRNNILYRGHRAWIQKQKALELVECNPAASQEALVDAILRLREIADYSSKMLPDWAWKEARKRFREKGIFFKRKPKAYGFSLFAFLKNFPLKERYRLSNVIRYYSFTDWGAAWLYRINRGSRKREEERIRKLAAESAGAG